MYRTWRRAAAAVAAALVLTAPSARAARVEIDGAPLPTQHGWGENGTSYVTLRGLSEAGGYELSWDGRSAVLEGEDLTLTAAPGQLYFEVNGRALYVEEGVGAVNGMTYLPLRLVAEAVGGELCWDGETTTAHLSLENARAARAEYNEEDLYWLSRIISAESRGESLLGQMAVGNVVLNRMGHENYPNTIREVIFDTNYGVQFEPVENGTVHDAPTERSVLAAKLCLEGASVVEDCIYFFAPALSPGTWIVQNGEYFTTIGCHRFYK